MPIVTVATFNPQTGVPNPYGLAPRFISIRRAPLVAAEVGVLIDSSELQPGERAAVFACQVTAGNLAAAAALMLKAQTSGTMLFELSLGLGNGYALSPPLIGSAFPFVVSELDGGGNGLGITITNTVGPRMTSLWHVGPIPGARFA